MKKIIILTLIALLFMTGSALGFEDLTGADWNKLTTNEKEHLIRGMQEGANWLTLIYSSEMVEFNTYKELDDILREENQYFRFNSDRLEFLNEYFAENPNKSFLDLMIEESEKTFGSDDSNLDEQVNNKSVEVVNIQGKIFERFEGEPLNQHSKIYINFKNNSSKVLTGLIYEMEVYDNFGDLIGKETNKSQIKIEPNERGYEYFVFYPNIHQTIYNLIANNTLKVDVNIQKAVFEDGSTVDFN